MARGNRALTRNCLTPIFVAALAGCASTTVETSGPRSDVQLCQPAWPTLVLWSTKWRPDQKDVFEREAAAWQGVQKFFLRSSCFGKAEIRSGSDVPADISGFGRVIVVTVRELGPILVIGSPSVLQGGTEVVLETRVIDGPSRAVLAEQRTHWKNGGPFVVKGVGSLEEDMAAALAAAFK